jgi:acetyltransferase
VRNSNSRNGEHKNFRKTGASKMGENLLHGFFHPKSIAIIGASKNPTRINHNLLANLVRLGYKGRIYPVHPEPGAILGIPTWKSVAELPEIVDLAVIGVSHAHTPKALEECARKGIKRVVLVAGGFSETGEEGRRVQEAMKGLLSEFGMRAVGPNALSPINSREGLAISFHPLERITPGGVSLIFQSGLYEPRLEWLIDEVGLRINKLMDLGNKMDLNEVEVLEYLSQDPDSKVIGIHLESAEGGWRRFFEALKRATEKVPVVVLKGGTTKAGAMAAASHTGVMAAGDQRLFSCAMNQAGAILAQTIEEFFLLCKALERLSEKEMRGPRVAFATLPGGEGVIVTDLCEIVGLRPAFPVKSSVEKLRPVFPDWEVGGNPFDLGVCVQFHPPMKVYELYLDGMLQDPQVDGLAIMLPRWVSRLSEEFLKPFQIATTSPKPVIVWVPGMHGGECAPLRWLEERGIPVFPSAHEGIRALAALYRHHKRKSKEGS